jgi:hypothetical protein
MFARFCAVLLGTLGAVGLVGCGQGAYEQTMVQTEAKLKQAGKFSGLSLFPVQIVDTPFQIRLPDSFAGRTGIRFFASQASDEGGTKLDELQPPFLKLPDLKVVYQAMGSDDKGSQYPYFCYLAALPPGAVFTAPAPKPVMTEPKPETPAEPPAEGTTENKPETPAENKPDAAAAEKPAEKKPEGTEAQPAEKPAEPPAEQPADKPAETPAEKPAGEVPAAPGEPVKLADWIKTQLNQAFPGKKYEWEPFDAPTPVLNQAPIAWQRISIEGIQPFQFIGGSSSDFLEQVDGKFVLYMCERDGTTVLVAWRVPKALEAKSPIEDWSRLAAGTLRP